MIERTAPPYLENLATLYPVVSVTGPRQSGKTTLCRATFADLPYGSLEAPDLRAFALEDPRGFLASYPDGVLLDEIQRAPELGGVATLSALDPMCHLRRDVGVCQVSTKSAQVQESTDSAIGSCPFAGSFPVSPRGGLAACQLLPKSLPHAQDHASALGARRDVHRL